MTPLPKRPVLRYSCLGCAGSLGLFVLLIVSSVVWLQGRGSATIASREDLDAGFATPATFTPPADGGFGADRLQRFLEVRGRLREACADFTAHAAAIERLDRLGEEDDAAPDLGLFGDVNRAFGAVFGVARQLDAYLITRNRAMLELEMGHGEYTWLHVMLFHGYLGLEPRRFALTNEAEPSIHEARVHPQVREMFARWIAQLEDTPPPDVELYRAEVALLLTDDARLPFADGWPPSLAERVEPFRQALEESRCAATDEIDVARTRREGIGFEHE